ncbi:hypothetical protein [Novipirellula artificiosorum]|uniref:Plasmid related protein n=1 Tax=Novipirellula artificiosorum TaxID=2528016 RepID=A0A5C6E2N3_9BACT|nr:hypothetical protein [Novipirellula artificiosorum]TWU41871.1 hypothetical protein Poly41_01640 [Novipirellula artificiosorum]
MIAPLKPKRPKFNLGRIVATPGALETLEESGESADSLICRHHTGDWGDVCEDDAAANEQALGDGERILSVYHTAKGEKLYVITEADRSSTCLLLPDEY